MLFIKNEFNYIVWWAFLDSTELAAIKPAFLLLQQRNVDLGDPDNPQYCWDDRCCCGGAREDHLVVECFEMITTSPFLDAFHLMQRITEQTHGKSDHALAREFGMDLSRAIFPISEMPEEDIVKVRSLSLARSLALSFLSLPCASSLSLSSQQYFICPGCQLHPVKERVQC